MGQWLRLLYGLKKKKKRKGTSFFPLRLINLRKIGSVFNVSAISLGLSFVEGVEFVGKIKRERERETFRLEFLTIELIECIHLFLLTRSSSF